MSETKKAKPIRKKKSRVWRFEKRLVKLIVILVILAIAALFALRAYIRSQAESTEKTESYSRTPVIRGAMEDTVYGTGTTSARSQPNILAETDGTLTDLRVEIGDTVREGDILAVITNEEIDDTITDLEFALWQLDDDITGTAAGSKVTTIEAPAAGRLVALYAQAGDDALAVFRREGALALISTDGRMKVELRGQTRALDLTLGESVVVTGEGFAENGTVIDLTQQGTVATITVLNDALPMDAPVTVSKQDGSVLGEGVLKVNKPMAVSFYGGTIKSVNAKVGDTIKRAQVLFKLEESPLTLKLEDLRLQREAAAKELEDAKAQRENLIILAPCDGTVATLEVAEGDSITSGTLIGSILHGEDMNLTIAVDELDVVDVAAGQKVKITVDALPDAEMTGEVYKIAPVGTNSGGVTTYDVELTFEAAGSGVRSGMNATGEIQVASTDSTLYVPVEAIMTIRNESYVMLADGGSAGTAAMAQSASTGSMRAQRGQNRTGSEGGTRSRSDAAAAGGMPEMSGAPDMSGMPDRGSMPQQTGETDGAEAAESASFTEKAKAYAQRVVSAVREWLYEGVETGEEQATGSLVKVTVGMQNDDYAEILSGVSEGDVVLYTASDEESSTRFGGMGNMGGMGGMRMGF